MGLSIWLEKRCKTCNHTETTDTRNVTYNVSPMWFLIFPDAKAMIDIDNMTGSESFVTLNYALSHLLAEPDKFKELNPPNNFGSYDGLISFIKQLLIDAKNYPDMKWKTWR